MTSMRPPNKTTMLKVVILGNGGVGKSCLMNRFVANTFDEHSFHTIGVEFLNRDLDVDGQKYTLQVMRLQCVHCVNVKFALKCRFTLYAHT